MAKVNVRNRNEGKKYKDGRSKPANWEFRIELAKIGNKRNQLTKAGFKTKKEAEVAGAKALAEYDRAGKVFEPSEISVADFFDYWLKNYCEINLADNTTNSYETIVRLHIKPRIGAYKLRSIDTVALQELVNAMHTEMHFSKKYIESIIKVLRQGFNYARKTAKYISVDPSEDIYVPNLDAEEEEVIVLSKDEVSAILSRFKSVPKYYYPILIAYYTGLRVSEVFGLTWDAIDFEKKTLTVNKAAKKFDYNARQYKKETAIRDRLKTKWYLGACKTPSSYRTIKIGDTLINALQDLKELQEENKAVYGGHYIRTYGKQELTKNRRHVTRIIEVNSRDEQPTDLEELHLVCVCEDGRFQGTSSMKYPSSVINKKLGIEFKFHALRHTHATMLIEQGVPIKSVSERLGHANSQVTWDIYVKVTDKIESDTVEVFEANADLQLRDEELYSLWKQTLNKKNISYYKNKGITICEEWLDFNAFEKFAQENGYASGLRLIRINKSGNYEPENCVFGTETKSVRGDYVYSDGVNTKSYSIRQTGRSWQYRITDYDYTGKRIDVQKAGFATENDAALAAEAKICEMLAEKKPLLRLVK